MYLSVYLSVCLSINLLFDSINGDVLFSLVRAALTDCVKQRRGREESGRASNAKETLLVMRCLQEDR